MSGLLPCGPRRQRSAVALPPAAFPRRALRRRRTFAANLVSALLPLLLWLALPAASARDTLTLALNWVPRADHAPFVFAQKQGWYRDAGIDLTIDSVTGSPAAVKLAAESERTLAVADFVPFLREWAKGAPATAVMVLEPRSPFAIYSAAQANVRTLSDLVDKRIAAQPTDILRSMWPAFAAEQGIDPRRVIWLDLANPAKPDALNAGEADAAFNPFLHNHLNYAAVLGERMRVLWWHQAGFPAYGHVLVAGTGLIDASPDLVQRFVSVSQRAWAHCLHAPRPCLDALLDEHPQLQRESEHALWRLVGTLYEGEPLASGALGVFDAARVARSLEQVTSAYGLRSVVSDRSPFTNRFVERR
jgi:NitT/TauT family transport system substrate-binding protein